MSNQRTEAFWRSRQQQTAAYMRAVAPTWRDRTEAIINKMDEIYCAVWDVMYALAAFAFLLWLINTIPHR